MKVSANFLFPLRGENNFKPHPQNKILVPLMGAFQNFRRVTLSIFILGREGGGGGGLLRDDANVIQCTRSCNVISLSSAFLCV